jgi:hypothetical protein
VTAGVRSGIGLTRLIGLERTDSVELRQNGTMMECLLSEIEANNEMFEVL